MTMGALSLRSTELRRARADVREKLSRGVLEVGDVFGHLDAYPCVHDLAVIDVLRMVQVSSRRGAWEHEIGRRAVRDGINLLVKVGSASERTLQWAAEHAPPSMVRRGLVAA